MIVETWYVCELCGHKYLRREEAMRCEGRRHPYIDKIGRHLACNGEHPFMGRQGYIRAAWESGGHTFFVLLARTDVYSQDDPSEMRDFEFRTLIDAEEGLVPPPDRGVTVEPPEELLAECLRLQEETLKRYEGRKP